MNKALINQLEKFNKPCFAIFEISNVEKRVFAKSKKEHQIDENLFVGFLTEHPQFISQFEDFIKSAREIITNPTIHYG